MKLFTLQVPGKILLAGEYTVLWGSSSLSLAIQSTMTFHCYQRPGAGVCMTSALWQEPKKLDLSPNPQVVEQPRAKDGGLNSLEESLAQVWRRHTTTTLSDEQIMIEISSEFGPNLGLGSSSAYLLGIFLCLLLSEDKSNNTLTIAPATLKLACDLARQAQLAFQGHSSGYDVLTQGFGGMLSYRSLANEPTWKYVLDRKDLTQKNIPWLHFAGNKTGAPTKAYVQTGQRFLQECPEVRQELTEANQRLQAAILAQLVDQNQALDKLIAAMESQRLCMERMPVYPKFLGQQLSSLPGCGKHWSFKTTGAGGEDLLLFVAEPRVWEHLQPELARLGLSSFALNPSPTGACFV